MDDSGNILVKRVNTNRSIIENVKIYWFDDDDDDRNGDDQQNDYQGDDVNT